MPDPDLTPIPDTDDGFPAPVAHLRGLGDWRLARIVGDFSFRHAVADDEISVAALAFSPDGRFVMAGGNSRVLWDADSGRLVREFLLPPGAEMAGISRVRFSPDGRFLAASAPYHPLAACAWDVASGEILGHVDARDLPELRDEPYCRITDVFADGRRVLVNVAEGKLQVFDLVASAWEPPISRAFGDPARAIPLPDASAFVLLDADLKAAIVADLGTGRELRRFEFPTAHALSLVEVSPDGRWLVGFSASGFRIFSLATGAEQLAGAVNIYTASLAFSADGRHFAVTQTGDEVAIFEVESQQMSQRFALPISTHETAAMAFAPDGKRLAVGSHRGEIFIWDVAGERWAFENAAPLWRPEDFAFSADVQTVTLRAEPDHEMTVELATARVLHASASRDRRITQESDDEIESSEEAGGETANAPDAFAAAKQAASAAPPHGTMLASGAVSPDGKWMVAATIHGPILIFEPVSR